MAVVATTTTATVRPTKLFIGGLSQNTTTKVLRTHFSEYGKVLDCVAMFNQDGRSRSFGYVTLDSLTAAEQCVAEPQVVDGRVVDVKLAVPEASAGKKAPSTRARRAVSTNASSRRDPKTRLSATAPAFVPQDAGASAEEEDPSDDYEAPQDVNDMKDLAEDDATMPLEPSTEGLSLSVEVVAARLAAAGVGAPPGLAPLTGLPAVRPPLPAMPPPPPPAPPALQVEGKAPLGNDDGEASTIAPSSSTVSPAVSQVQLEESDACSEDLAEDSELQLLPSAGSALHAVGQCRPCNFFGKGRCENGIDCEFCHMPHQKRKPTRQEKRERAAAWMERQKSKAEEEAKARSEAEKAQKAAALAAQADQAKPVVQPIVPTMVPSALPGLMFNFDCFSDDSDDDEDVPVQAAPLKAALPAVVPEEETTTAAAIPEEERVWSRELMLALKSTMDSLGKSASEGEKTKLITLR